MSAPTLDFLLGLEGKDGTPRQPRVPPAGNFDTIYGDIGTGAAVDDDDTGRGDAESSGEEASSDEDEGVEIILASAPLHGGAGGDSGKAVTGADGGAATLGQGAANGPSLVGLGGRWAQFVRSGTAAGADGNTSAPAAAEGQGALAGGLLAHVPGGLEALKVSPTAALELDIDTLVDKPWREPGADVTDYFNYGFTEETWRAYCRRQLELRFLKDQGGAAAGPGGDPQGPPARAPSPMVGSDAQAGQRTPSPVPDAGAGVASSAALNSKAGLFVPPTGGVGPMPMPGNPAPMNPEMARAFMLNPQLMMGAAGAAMCAADRAPSPPRSPHMFAVPLLLWPPCPETNRNPYAAAAGLMGAYPMNMPGMSPMGHMFAMGGGMDCPPAMGASGGSGPMAMAGTHLGGLGGMGGAGAGLGLGGPGRGSGGGDRRRGPRKKSRR